MKLAQPVRAASAMRLAMHTSTLTIRFCLAAFMTLFPLHLAAAQGSRQTCEPLQPIGNSPNPSDSAYNRCALERAPVLPAGSARPVPPLEDTEPSGTFYVIVNSDGTVDPRLTQIFSRTSDTTFFRRAMETIRQWHFEPGIYRGAPVRSSFMLEIQSTAREDTLPSTLSWAYHKGSDADTLSGTWATAAAVAPFDAAATDRVYAALVRQLIRMQIVKTGYLGPTLYCIVLENGDSVEHARISNLLESIINPPRNIDFNGTPLAPYGCERSVSYRRIIIPRVHRTENGRAVLFPSGDYLPNWPPDLGGRAWSAWSGRCVATVPSGGSVWINCSLAPAYRPEERPSPTERKLGGDSVRARVIVMMEGAYTRDTLNAVFPSLPQLSTGAIHDFYPCGGWAAYSFQQSAELYVVYGNPAAGSLHLTRVTRGQAPSRTGSPSACNPPKPDSPQFVAFLLGDLGDRPNAPITLCFSDCAKSYVLNPAQHTLLDRAHFTFRLKDLREDTRAGEQLRIRILVDPAPKDLVPIVVIREHNLLRETAWIPNPVGPNVWDYDVIYSGGYSPDTEVHIYLVVR